MSRLIGLIFLLLLLAGCSAAADQSGADLFARSCAGCHGAQGEGVPGLTEPLRGSERLRALSDEQLIILIKDGIAADDPANSSGLAMPPYGGNRSLSDGQLQMIVDHMRRLGSAD